MSLGPKVVSKLLGDAIHFTKASPITTKPLPLTASTPHICNLPEITGQKPVALLLGWLGAKPRHFSKFSDWYSKCGVPSISHIPTPLGVLSPSLSRQRAQTVVTALQRYLDSSPDDKVIVHTLSGNGLLFYRYMLEIPAFQSVSDRVSALIVDSAPPQLSMNMFTRGLVGAILAATGQQASSSSSSSIPKKPNGRIRDDICGLNFPIHDWSQHCNGTIQPVGPRTRDAQLNITWPRLSIGRTEANKASEDDKLLAQEQAGTFDHPILSPLVEKILRHEFTFGDPVSYFGNLLGSFPELQPKHIKQLYLFGDGDTLIPPEAVLPFVRAQAAHGFPVSEAFFHGSGHVQHFREYPCEYTSIALNFIANSLSTK